MSKPDLQPMRSVIEDVARKLRGAAKKGASPHDLRLLAHKLEAAAQGIRLEHRWIPVEEQLPDADLTVFAAISDADEPVWLAYYGAIEEGDRSWTTVEGMPCNVTHWKPMPEPPCAECDGDGYVGLDSERLPCGGCGGSGRAMP